MHAATHRYLGFALLAALLSCMREPAAPALTAPDYEMRVELSSAVYYPDSNRVFLQWRRLSQGAIDFYRVYVTSRLDSSDNPDLSALESFGQRREIRQTASEVTFQDVPGLSDTVYFYVVCGVRLENGNEIEGAFSNAVSCTVSSVVNFTINGGDLFAVDDDAKLVLVDNRDTVVSVRFTQEYADSLVKIDSNGNVVAGVAVNLNDPNNLPSAEELNQLVSNEWLNSMMQIDTGTVKQRRTPLFGQSSQLPRAGRVSSYDWVLRKGNGVKQVWAEVHKKDGLIDTLYDEIRIRPYRVKFNLRNSTDVDSFTMRVLEEGADENGKFRQYYIYVPAIEFSVSIFSDPTFVPEFQYWLAFPDDSVFKLDQKRAWYETAPRQAALTGEGPAHDDRNVYEYSIDPRTEWGQANLRELKLTRAPPVAGQIALRLRGVEQFNESAAPGSYWGANPMTMAGVGTLGSSQKTVTATPEENYRKLIALRPDVLTANGRKEFMIIALFRGKHFDDVRTAVSGRLINSSVGVESYVDLYPPRAELWDKDNSEYITNGAVIKKSFSYSLVQSQSVIDLGRARVEAIELVVAQMPSGMIWDADSTPFALTPDDLLRWRHDVLPFEIRVPSRIIGGVRWADVDPSRWSSGQYLMGIVTADEFGNRGFAAVKKAGGSSNPWRVMIQSGN